MGYCSQRWLLSVAILLLLSLTTLYSQALPENKNRIKSTVFLSPEFTLGPGSVENKYYFNIDFPRGHIGIKGFDAEVIDEAGNPVPLHETYLHHWVVGRYYERKGTKLLDRNGDNNNKLLNNSNHIFVRNHGICQTDILGQYFGLGSETRKTSTHVPDPFGIEVGNPSEIPDGFEEKWLLNVHAIDTRGVEDRVGCTECKCNLYNITVDEYGRVLRPDYDGGLLCCYDQTQCKLRQGFQGVRRNLYLRYKVSWVDWVNSVVPVKIYIFDVTDTWKKSGDEHGCKIEFEVKPCNSNGGSDAECVDSRRVNLEMPVGGNVIYGVAHQHSGGIGSALYGEDGREICSSIPAYGKGSEAGNEGGYIVGMSTCYPKPGSVKLAAGETLTLESNYSSSSSRGHLGVMGLFYILVAEELTKPVHSSHVILGGQQHKSSMNVFSSLWVAVFLGCVVIAIVTAVGVHYRRRNKEECGYESLS